MVFLVSEGIEFKLLKANNVDRVFQIEACMKERSTGVQHAVVEFLRVFFLFCHCQDTVLCENIRQ